MCSFTPSGPHPNARAEQLEREITELRAHLNAATFRLL